MSPLQPDVRPRAPRLPEVRLATAVLEADDLDVDTRVALSRVIEDAGLVDGRPQGLDSAWRQAGLRDAVDRAP